jgi:membrane-bound lytic murein transglycosylase B
MTVALPMAEWQQLGVRLSDGAALPETAPPAAMVSGATRHFLVFHNYDVLLEYNCAHSYAISVGLLADRIAPSSPAPRHDEKTARNRGSRRRARH